MNCSRRLNEAPSEGARKLPGKSSAQPAREHRDLPIRGASLHLLQCKRVKMDVGDTSGETLATLLEQLRRGRPEDEVSPRPSVTVNENPQEREELRKALNFIETDKLAGMEGRVGFGIAQARPIRGKFEIKVQQGSFQRQNSTRERRFP